MLLDQIHASFVNLDCRPDRLVRMDVELKRVGIEAQRVRGILPAEYKGQEYKVRVMRARTPGAIGCHMAQVQCIQNAQKVGKSALVMEDDLEFASDLPERLQIIEDFLAGRHWDVFWLGGTYHLKPPVWHAKGHPQLRACRCRIGKDVEATEDPRIVRTYGCWSTYAYLVNYKSMDRILRLLDGHIHLSIGIDWLFILLQPLLMTYAFVPGCVKQYDNRSNIGDGDTIFSNFHKLGPYWFQDRMTDFDYEKFKV